jgi:hypothetical protein
LTLLAAEAAAQPLATRLDAALAAPPERYPERRRELLAAGPAARTFLAREAVSGADPVRRTIARALSRRAGDPRRAAALDRWRPSPETSRLHNPEFRARAELTAAYAGEPALAFERLFSAARPSDFEVLALGDVVVAGRGDAFAVLATLVGRHGALADFLVQLDRAAAEDVLSNALAAGPPRETTLRLVAALGHAAGPHRGRALASLRSTFATSRDDDTRRAAVRALASRGDRGAVPTLFASLLEADQTAGQGTRREVTLGALGQILGAADLDRELLRRAADRDEPTRRVAAFALGHRAPAARWNELLHTFPRDAQALATLAADASPAVREAALESLAWLAIRIGVRPPGGQPAPLPRTVAASVVASLQDRHPEVRRQGLSALWRLSESHLLHADASARRAVERIAREDPDLAMRSFAREVSATMARR